VLRYCGLKKLSEYGYEEYSSVGMGHVHFQAAEGLIASIPTHKASRGRGGDVLLAYEMNGEDIPREHGYPIRYILPCIQIFTLVFDITVMHMCIIGV
jgi:hypothetical protein